MMHMFAPTGTGPAGVLLVALLVAAPAAADPPRGERALLSADAPPVAAASRGDWRTAAGQVGPTQKRLKPSAFWLAQGPPLINGVVRARFSHGWRINVHLVARARLAKNRGRLAHGVGVRVHGRYLWLTEIKDGKARRLTGVYKMWAPSKRRIIEVVLTLHGKYVVASAFELPKNRHLGTVITSRAPGEAGGVALLSTRKNDPRSPLLHLATRPACKDVPASTGKGPFVTFELPAADEKEASRVAGVRLLERVADGEPARHVYRADAAGLERLACAGRAMQRTTARLPWKYTDLSYLQHRDAPPVKTPTGFRIDQSVKNPTMVEALLRAYHKRFPKKTRLVRLGKSHQGRPFHALVIGDPSPSSRRPSVLLNAAHHGSEVMATQQVLDAIQVLLEAAPKDARVKRWLQKVNVWCVPLINPDGLVGFLDVDRATGRKNGYGLKGNKPRSTGMGVDLNRNYPYRWGVGGERASSSKRKSRYYHGPAAASEPETRAMMRLARRERFAASISFHTGTVDILAPYNAPGVKSPEPNMAWAVAQHLADGLQPHPQHLDPKTEQPMKARVRSSLYPVNGTDQDWLRHSFGTVALLVEGAHWTPLDLVKRRKVTEAVRPSWELLLDRFLDGPAVSGFVSDVRGRPVHAVVSIGQIKTHQKERWTTRPRDGRFDRILPGAGTYTVQVHAAGYRQAARKVKIGAKEHRVLRFTLRKR